MSAPAVRALRKPDAAAAMGVSDETFDRHVRPTLECVHIGSVTVYPLAAIERWLEDRAEAPADELKRLTSRG